MDVLRLIDETLDPNLYKRLKQAENPGLEHQIILAGPSTEPPAAIYAYKDEDFLNFISFYQTPFNGATKLTTFSGIYDLKNYEILGGMTDKIICGPEYAEQLNELLEKTDFALFTMANLTLDYEEANLIKKTMLSNDYLCFNKRATPRVERIFFNNNEFRLIFSKNNQGLGQIVSFKRYINDENAGLSIEAGIFDIESEMYSPLDLDKEPVIIYEVTEIDDKVVEVKDEEIEAAVNSVIEYIDKHFEEQAVPLLENYRITDENCVMIRDHVTFLDLQPPRRLTIPRLLMNT